jgi:hypothetical protein
MYNADQDLCVVLKFELGHKEVGSRSPAVGTGTIKVFCTGTASLYR